MKRILPVILILLFSFTVVIAKETNPVFGLLERISPGSSRHFSFEIEDELSEEDFFQLESKGGKIHISGNNWISVATGLNWYLKYYARVNITWSNPVQNLVRFPKIEAKVRRSTNCLVRYYLSYNSFTYSTPFWDWKRWQQEIDFMALHGINAPLALTGSQIVWYRTLSRLGYNYSEICDFVGDITHQPQVLMGVMEGRADTLSSSWMENQSVLVRKILNEYDKWGMTPVLPAFSGIVPSKGFTSSKKFSLGQWCGSHSRPSVLNPDDPNFEKVAQIYYQELEKLCGKSKYYSCPLFPKVKASAVYASIQKASPESVWFTDAPIADLDGLPAGKIMILDISSETNPKWGDPDSPNYNPEGYYYHNWLFCQKNNYGGRIGMYGKMQRLINSYFLARKDGLAKNMSGIGAVPDGIGENPAIWEMFFELPWRSGTFLADDWLKQFVAARYGHPTKNLTDAWQLILETLYSPDKSSQQEGPVQSVICARPALEVDAVSKGGTTVCFYDRQKVVKALELLLIESDRLKYSKNYAYDVQQLARTVNSDYAAQLLSEINEAFSAADSLKFDSKSAEFLNLISLQDNLMNCREETMVGCWIERSMALGTSIEESNIFRKEARRLITTWGDHSISNIGGMNGYAYKEWGGVIRDLYYERWLAFFQYISQNHVLPIGYDFYDMEDDWINATNPYSFTPTNTSINMAQRILNNIQRNEKK